MTLHYGNQQTNAAAHLDHPHALCEREDGALIAAANLLLLTKWKIP